MNDLERYMAIPMTGQDLCGLLAAGRPYPPHQGKKGTTSQIWDPCCGSRGVDYTLYSGSQVSTKNQPLC